MAVLVLCAMFWLASFSGSDGLSDLAGDASVEATSRDFGIAALCFGSAFFMLLGLGSGLVALLQREGSKVWGIVGLVLNGLIVLAFCGVVGVSLLLV